MGVVKSYGIIEGVYFEHLDGTIFYAKGLIHPPHGVVGFPKYVPLYRGNIVKYLKVGSLKSQIKTLEKKFPTYLNEDKCLGCRAPVVPLKDIRRIYDPVDVLHGLRHKAKGKIEQVAIKLAQVLAEYIGWDNIGISGSILIGLHTERSDIDLVIYGNVQEAYETLKEAHKKGILTDYSEDKLASLHGIRSKETPMDYKIFKLHQQRKVLEGLFRGFEYFIRLIDPSIEPPYCTFKVKKLGIVKLRGRVKDSSKSILTPCTYEVNVDEVLLGTEEAYMVSRLYSLRGRFCEMIREGEEFEARGTLELVEYGKGSHVYRLYLGYEGDYLVSLSLLQRKGLM